MDDQGRFFAAIKAGEIETVQDLVGKNATLASERAPEGVSALLLSLYFGQAEIGEFLASQLSEVDFFEAAALGLAARVEELVEVSREVTTQHSPDGFTGLHLAAFFGHPQVVELLLGFGADPNTPATGSMDVRPLHSAVAGRNPEAIVPIVRALLNRGAEVNCAQQGGFTALHGAAVAGNQELVSFLLERGAKVGSETEDGKTALDLALEKGHRACADLLTGWSP